MKNNKEHSALYHCAVKLRRNNERCYNKVHRTAPSLKTLFYYPVDTFANLIVPCNNMQRDLGIKWKKSHSEYYLKFTFLEFIDIGYDVF